MKTPRFFVTATDTGVGKTHVACALLELMALRGFEPAAFKPYESGCRRLSSPADAQALRTAAGGHQPLSSVCLYRFRAPLAPGVAAMREGRRPSWEKTLRTFRGFRGRPLVVEGAGGLLVPLDQGHDVLDLIEALRLPVVLVARAGLGTLNHTGLSLMALRSRGIQVRAVVLSCAQPGMDVSVEDNATLISQRHAVKVIGPIPWVKSPSLRRKEFRAALSPLL